MSNANQNSNLDSLNTADDIDSNDNEFAPEGADGQLDADGADDSLDDSGDDGYFGADADLADNVEADDAQFDTVNDNNKEMKMQNEENENPEQEHEDTMDAEGSIDAPVHAKEAKTPAWQVFRDALSAKAESLGLKVKEQAGYIQYLNADTGHKLYVAKGGKEVKRIDTTLPLVGKLDSAYALEKPVGRIACHIKPDVDAVSAALGMLADPATGKIPAPKRHKKDESVQTAE